MSGFFGIFRPQGGPVDLEAFEQMKTAMHRDGFDGMETHVEEKIAMGHLMLRVSAESEYDKQPLKSSCGNYILVGHFRLDYRDELGDKLGLTQSELDVTPDSRLAMLAYQKWGEKCVHYLEGDWAFMIYSLVDSTLFAAKDTFGYSALFYSKIGDEVLFSSDVDVFKSINKIPFTINFKNLFALSFPELGKEKGETLIHEISVISPRNYILVDNYCSIRLFSVPKIKSRNTILQKHLEDYYFEFESIIQLAIKSKSRLSGKIGLMLSSGFDSTTVASFLYDEFRNTETKINTYTAYPASLDFIKPNNYHLVDESKPVASYLQGKQVFEPIFLNFSDEDSAEILSENKINNIFNPLITPNTFWIEGIVKKASDDKVKRLFNAQAGNYTLTYSHPFYNLYLLRNFKILLLCKSVKMYSKSRGLTLAKSVRQTLLKEIFAFVNYKFSFLKFSATLSDSIIKRDKLKLSKVSELISRHYAKKIIDSTIEPNSNRLKSLYELYEYTGINWFKYSHNHHLECVDPTADIRLVNYVTSIPLFFSGDIYSGLNIFDNFYTNRIPSANKIVKFKKLQAIDIGSRILNSITIRDKMHAICTNESFGEVFKIERIKKRYKENFVNNSISLRYKNSSIFLRFLSLLCFYEKNNN